MSGADPAPLWGNRQNQWEALGALLVYPRVTRGVTGIEPITEYACGIRQRLSQCPKVLSPLDIMNELRLENLCDSLIELRRLQSHHENHDCWLMGAEASEKDKEEFTGYLYTVVDELRKQCTEADFFTAHPLLERIQNHLEGKALSPEVLAVEARHAIEAMLSEFEARTYMFIPSGMGRSNWNNKSYFGEAVAKAFPSAIPDIERTSNCMMTSCHTAAVFHSMRVVEWGLRGLCADIGLIRVKRTFKATKKSSYTPINYVDWETMLNQLQDRVDSRINKMKRGRQKQKAQEFYYPALQDIRGIRDAWRNHVMHSRAIYGAADAAAILGHVNRLMTTLSTKIREVK